MGVPQSPRKAVEYFKMSADKDCKEAFNSLGNAYYYGYGDVDKNYVEALKWYTKSAEKHCDKGQFNLGLMYLNGEGTDINHDLALYWMKKAAYNGIDKGHTYVEKISQMIIQDLGQTNKITSSSSDSINKLEEAEKAAKAAEEKIALLARSASIAESSNQGSYKQRRFNNRRIGTANPLKIMMQRIKLRLDTCIKLEKVFRKIMI